MHYQFTVAGTLIYESVRNIMVPYIKPAPILRHTHSLHALYSWYICNDAEIVAFARGSSASCIEISDGYTYIYV